MSKKVVALIVLNALFILFLCGLLGLISSPQANQKIANNLNSIPDVVFYPASFLFLGLTTWFLVWILSNQNK